MCFYVILLLFGQNPARCVLKHLLMTLDGHPKITKANLEPMAKSSL